MKVRTVFVSMALAAASALVASPAAVAQAAPPPPPAAGIQPQADPWPRDVALANASVVVYQPQVNSWTGNQLSFRVALALKPAGSSTPSYGTASGTARTVVDRGARLVDLEDFGPFEFRFPALADNGAAYIGQLKQALNTTLQTISLNRLEASLRASGTAQHAAVEVNNTPPSVIVSYGPAFLVPISGAPVVKDVPGTRFERVINTQALIARTRLDDTWYLHLYDGWVSSQSFQGPWTKAPRAPLGLDEAAQKLAKSGAVDLLDGGPGATPKPSLANGVPAIYVTQTPTELVVFKGQPNFVPVTGTNLLWASNTAADVFINTANSGYYILISGRWYTAPGINGPWTFVAANALPPDFAHLPTSGPPSVVLASVADTPQAQEALIANSIPQDATISRTNGPKFTPVFDGAPQYAPVPATPLQYVVNSQTPIIQTGPGAFYAVQAGVWFTASAVTGPWVIATAVPQVVYTIPAASPLHYVTYVRIYGYTPEVVYVGYTPGYLGTVVAPGGVVVYGTGYPYTPWIGTVYYPPPFTYGLAAAPVYNPAVGFTFGFAMGLATAAMVQPYWGGAYYHPYYGGYPCCGSASANVYRNWGTGVSSGTRTWYSNPGGAVGTRASGTYATARGTTGSYAAGRSYNPYTGQAQEGYARTASTASGATGSVARGQSYNTQTGQRSYASSGSATGAGGDSVSRSAAATAGPEGYGRTATTTTYNAKTGQTNTWTNGEPGSNNHYADSQGNVQRSSESGWQEHSSSGWQAPTHSTASAEQEQQARSTAQSRENSYHSDSGGWDRSGSDSSSPASRFGGEDRTRSSFADRFGGDGFRGGGFRGRR